MRFGLASVIVVGFAFMTSLHGQEGTGTKDAHGAMAEKCAKACGDCQRMCDMCAKHCADLLAQGKKEHVKTLATCQDCATFCSAAACIVSRQGPFSDEICKSCAEACARCGKACEEYPNEPTMKRCAEECRRCEQACKEMLKHATK
jgi:hypothetical protein